MDVGYIGLGTMAMNAVRDRHGLVILVNRRECRLRNPSNTTLAWTQVYATDQT